MPQWAGGSWYELRRDHPSSERFTAPNEAYWMGPRPAELADDPVASTCTSAVLNTRFAPAVFQVLAQILWPGPASALASLTAGWSIRIYIQAYAYTDARGSYVPAGR